MATSAAAHVAGTLPPLGHDAESRPASGRSRAAAAILLDHAHLLLPLAARLDPGLPMFESAIHGSSMAPAIPSGSALRVRVIGRQACQPGDVVFYLADGGYTVHRVVYRRRGVRGPDHLVTAGDARFAPDPPVPCDRVLGIIVEVRIADRWQSVGAASAGPWFRRVVRTVTLATVVAALSFSVTAASRLADALLALESRSRLAVGRLRRYRREPGSPGASAGSVSHGDLDTAGQDRPSLPVSEACSPPLDAGRRSI